MVAALAAPIALRADSLGSGYSCAGKTLTLKGKTVTGAAAKTKIGLQVAALKAQVKSAKTQKRKDQLKAKIAAAKAVLAATKQCAAGTYVQKIFSTIAKAYTAGSWNNTTFSTSGGISANMALNGATLSVSINIGGSMFGSLMPGPVEFQKNVGGAEFPFKFTVTGTSIGDLDVTFSASGDLQVEETVVPSRPDILRATLAATFDGTSSYSGEFHSYLAGNTQLAQGTITLAP